MGNDNKVFILEAITAFFNAAGFSSGVASTIPNAFFKFCTNTKYAKNYR